MTTDTREAIKAVLKRARESLGTVGCVGQPGAANTEIELAIGGALIDWIEDELEATLADNADAAGVRTVARTAEGGVQREKHASTALLDRMTAFYAKHGGFAESLDYVERLEREARDRVFSFGDANGVDVVAVYRAGAAEGEQDYLRNHHDPKNLKVNSLMECNKHEIRHGIAAVVNALTAAGAAQGEPNNDDLSVDHFAFVMKEKLAQARAKGRGGWNSEQATAQSLSDALRAHVEKGDPRDVANFAMFLYIRGESIQPAAQGGGEAVYQVKLAGNGWHDASREGYDLAIVDGRPHRILYATPTPAAQPSDAALREGDARKIDGRWMVCTDPAMARFVSFDGQDTPAAVGGGAWQLIETAPLDGTVIVIGNAGGSWAARYRPYYQSGYRPDNPWQSMMLNHDHIPDAWRFKPATHWRPLDATIAAEQGDAR